MFLLWEHKGQRTSLKIGQNTKHQRHGNAVPDSKAEEVAFLPDHIGSGCCNGERLGRDHFCGDAARSIGSHGQFGRHSHRNGRIFLHTAEEGARGRVGTGQEYAEPTENRGEEGEECSCMGKARPSVVLMPE